MGRNETSIFIFIAAVILGVMISLNISFNGKNTKVFLNAKQYEEAWDKRNKLLKETSDLKDQYNEEYDKYIKYKYGDTDEKDVSKQIESELNENKLKIGTTDVQGQGIKITMNDATMDFKQDYTKKNIIHDIDLLMVINDLKSAGAEAISVNGQRIVDNTYMYCGGSYINVNGVKTPTPFYISAIGNKDALKNYMLLDENYLKYLMSDYRRIRVSIEEFDNIKISGYTGSVKYNFMKGEKTN